MLFLSKANSSRFLKSFFNSASLTKRDQVNKSGLSFFVILLSAGILFAYTVLRARLLSFVHDESLSYFVINHVGHWWSTANNHLLNSVLMLVCQKLFGDSELSLRLPNLFAHLLFMIFSILILKKLKDDILTTSGFLLLNTNPFMLDFFGLARGYGLSLSFMMVSIYYFIKMQETQHQYNKMLFYTFYFANLAILANFMMLNYYLSLIVVIFWHWAKVRAIFIIYLFFWIGAAVFSCVSNEKNINIRCNFLCRIRNFFERKQNSICFCCNWIEYLFICEVF